MNLFTYFNSRALFPCLFSDSKMSRTKFLFIQSIFIGTLPRTRSEAEGTRVNKKDTDRALKGLHYSARRENSVRC